MTCWRYFYPRPPRGGRRASVSNSGTNDEIFLSTPSARRATVVGSVEMLNTIFLSTPSARRATKPAVKQTRQQKDFYPRPPRGGRPQNSTKTTELSKFLSTPSARRATLPRFLLLLLFCDFYPRPPRGGRQLWLVAADFRLYFYPRPPRGGRPTLFLPPLPSSFHFYPRPPRGGRQQKQRQNLYFQTNYTTFCTNLEEP